MKARAHLNGKAAIARVLAVAPAGGLTPVCLELMRRGASVSAIEGLQEAAAAARLHAFDVILVAAREDSNATALLLNLLKAEALGSPRILLLVDPQRAASFSHALFQADETVSADLDAARLADATGLGAEPETPYAYNLPAVIAEVKTKILALPTALPRDMIPEGMAQVARGEVPDAVVITQSGAAAAMASWMSAATAAVVPVIDATGQLGLRADASIDTMSPHSLAAAMAKVEPISIRMKSLPDAFHRTRDARQMLLARLATRDRAVSAARDPGSKQIISYPDESAIGGLLAHAENLTRAGLLERKFFDKLQCCPSCNSSRLVVREECSKCRSGDICEEPIIHHLRCGKMGPERDYRQGRELICPKCRHHLEHFSVDYDKPGMLTLCNGCGHTTGEPEIGFSCLDCASHFETGKAKTRSFYEYALTESGREAAFAPPLGGYGEAVDSEDRSVRERLRRFTTSNRQAGSDCAAMLVKLDPDGEIAAKIGEKRFSQAVALYASLLHEVFEQEVEIVESATTFLVLISGEGAELVRAALPEIRRELEQHLSVDLAPRYHVFGPAEISSML